MPSLRRATRLFDNHRDFVMMNRAVGVFNGRRTIITRAISPGKSLGESDNIINTRSREGRLHVIGADGGTRESGGRR